MDYELIYISNIYFLKIRGFGVLGFWGFGVRVAVRVGVRVRVGVIPRGRRASTRGAREARPHITRPGRRGTL